MGACGSVCNYSIPEICVICGNMVCISCIWFVGNVSGGYCDLAGNDRSSSGYAAASGRHGNQRAVVPSNILTDIWKPVIASGYDFKPGTWLLHGVVYQCDIYDRGKLYNRKKRRGLIC